MGFPDKPPVSDLSVDINDSGREVDVFVRMIPSTWNSSNTLEISAMASSSRSGANLTKSGGCRSNLSRAVRHVVSIALSSDVCCISRSPGVLGELMLTTR